MKGDALRGVLSSRYARLDHDLLLDTLMPLVPQGFAVDWFSLDDTGLHLRLVDPRTPQSVLPGDDLLCGIHVANSEVGRRAVTVDALVYRLVCQNGLIRLVKGKSLLHRRHVSFSASGFKEALEAAVLGALAEAGCFLEQIRARRPHAGPGRAGGAGAAGPAGGPEQGLPGSRRAEPAVRACRASRRRSGGLPTG